MIHETFRVYSNKYPICQNMISRRNEAYKKWIHYSDKLQKIRPATDSRSKAKIPRNENKLQLAIRNFESINNEAHKMMTELAINKQKVLNPCMTKMFAENLSFFRKMRNAFSAANAVDIEG